MSKIISIKNSDEFKKIIKIASPILINFHADWCNPCKQLIPLLEQLSINNLNVKFIEIDFDKSKDITDELSIRHLPCIISYFEGKELDRIVGYDDIKLTKLVTKLSSISIFLNNSNYIQFFLYKI